MNRYILLLRGVNVGGKNILPMKILTEVLLGEGLSDVKTYIQSGNIVFSSDKNDKRELENLIKAAIKKHFSITPGVLLLTAEQLASAINRNPFREAESEPKSLHLGFLSEFPDTPDIGGMEKLKTETEAFELIESVFYLFAPDGTGRSGLAAASERLLGVSMTDRNWNTVCRLRDMIG